MQITDFIKTKKDSKKHTEGEINYFIKNLDKFTQEEIIEWLVADLEMPRKQRHTGKRVFDRLKEKYGDDLDIGWRMRLFGWKQVYSPEVVMSHDRSTTKGLSERWVDYFLRIKDRKKIPIFKKRLDWRNKRLARIKNDYGQNMLKDFFPMLWREISELGYITIFEPAVLLEIPKLIRLLPRTLKKRRVILARAQMGPKEMAHWFI